MILCLCSQGSFFIAENNLLVIKEKIKKFRNFQKYFVILHCYNIFESLEDKKNPNFKNKIQRRKTMKLLKLLNHDLTKEQLNELKNDFNVDEIVTISPDNAKKFAQVTLDSYNDVIDSVNAEIKQLKPDYMFIQGQPGVVHNIVNDNPDVVSLFAFTQRISVDTPNADGTVTKTNVFKHQKFMKYARTLAQQRDDRREYCNKVEDMTEGNTATKLRI